MMDPNACLRLIDDHLWGDSGDYDECLQAIEDLAAWIGKGGFKPDELGSLNWWDALVGAYWFCHDWHGGQWSDEYRLLCIVGEMYTPGPLCRGVDVETGEADVYDRLCELSGANEMAPSPEFRA